MLANFSIRTARYIVEADDILLADVNEGAEHTLADAEEEYRIVGASCQRFRLMVDLSKIRSISRDARALYSGPRSVQLYGAQALVVSSPLSRAMGNFFLSLNKPLVPTRLFTSRDEARAWLREQPLDRRDGVERGRRGLPQRDSATPR